MHFHRTPNAEHALFRRGGVSRLDTLWRLNRLAGCTPDPTHSWTNEGSYFDDVLVEDLFTGTVLLSEDFNGGDFSEWTIVDEGPFNGPSLWSAATGTLVQSANIHDDDGSGKPAELPKLGTYALYWALIQETIFIAARA